MAQRTYLGETIVDTSTHPTFAERTKEAWAMEFITRYGQIDGESHKAWVLDQVSRILLGTPVVVKRADWSDGKFEYRFTVGSPSATYAAWLKLMRRDGYDKGTAP
jgi:hypothetical protein